MKTIYKKALRDLLKNKFQYSCVLLVVILGSALFLGFSSTARVEDEFLEDYVTEYNLPDLWVYYSSVSDREADIIADIDGVEDAAARFQGDLTVDFDGRQSKLTMMSYNKDSDLAKAYVCDGKMPEEPYEVAVDAEYADANDLEIGDEIQISINNHEMTMNVVGLVESAEYMIKLPDTMSDIPDPEAYGIGFFNFDTITEELGGEIPYNQIIVKIKDDADANDVAKKIEEKADKDTFVYCASRKLNTGYSMIESHVEQNTRLGFMFPAVFYLIAAVIVFITLSNTINSQRTQIGVMKALGYKNSKIVMHYMLDSLVISVVGTVAGGILGNIVVPKILIFALKRQFDIPTIEPKFYIMNIIPSVLLMSAFAAAATVLSCRKMQKENAASEMRPLTPGIDHKLLLEKASGIWDKFKMDSRIVLRNIFLNKRRMILSMIGIVGSTAVIIAGIGLKQSVDKLLVVQYQKILKSDAEVSLLNTVNLEDGSAEVVDPEKIELPEGTDALKYTRLLCEFKPNADDIIYVNVVAFEDDDYEDFFSILNEDGENIKLNDDGFIISQRIANKYGYKVGDTVTFTNIDSNYETVGIEGKVTGISYQYLSQDVFCTPEFLARNGITPKTLNMYVNIIDEKLNYEDIEDKFLDMPEVLAVKSIDKIEQDEIEWCEVIILDAIVMAIVAMIISLAVISCISSINYLERRRVLATMKACGYSNRQIFKLFVRENLFITVIGAIIGVPVGMKILAFVLNMSETTTCAYPYPPVALNCTIAVVLVIVYTLIANLTVRRKIKKLNMVEILKNVE